MVCHPLLRLLHVTQQAKLPNVSRVDELLPIAEADGLSVGGRSPGKTAPAGGNQVVKCGVAAIRAAQDLLGDPLANCVVFSAVRFRADAVERDIHDGQGMRIKLSFDHLSAP
jgi:hypothetical protein